MLDSLCSQNLPRNIDFNGKNQFGAGYYQCNIKDGVRQSSAKAFLEPIKDNENLFIFTNHLANKVVFDGKRTTGVNVTDQSNNTEYLFEATQEVILSGGSF